MKRVLGLFAIVVVLASAGVIYKLSSGQQSVERLRIGMIPITDGAQVYAAQEMGLFRDEGLEVDIISMKGGAATLPALSSGAVDIAFTNTASAVFYEESVGPLTSLAGGVVMDSAHSESGLLVRADSGIRDIAMLRNKTVGINVKRNILALAVARAFRKAGLRPGDYEVTEIPFPQMEAALLSGRVDAVTAPEPFLSSIVGNGQVRNLGDVYVLGFGEVFAVGYFTTPRNISRRSEAFQRFNKAISQATAPANRYDNQILSAIARYTGISTSVLEKAGRPRFVDRCPTTALDTMREWMKEEGFLD